MSNRIIATESPSIEDVLETYEVVPGIISLALGSVHWSPPEEALAKLVPALSVRATHRYGNVLGDDDLRDHLKQLVQRQGNSKTRSCFIKSNNYIIAFFNRHRYDWHGSYGNCRWKPSICQYCIDIVRRQGSRYSSGSLLFCSQARSPNGWRYCGCMPFQQEHSGA